MDSQGQQARAIRIWANYLIDIENAVIVDVEATPARTYDEVAATQTMLDRAEKRFDLRPRRLAADTAYGTGKFLGWSRRRKSSRTSRYGMRARSRAISGASQSEDPNAKQQAGFFDSIPNWI
jgi:hypothetical protein